MRGREHVALAVVLGLQGGLTNVPQLHKHSAYGPHVCTITPGLLANYYGPTSASTAPSPCRRTVDGWRRDHGSHFVPSEDALRVHPIQTRGIPHGFVPGVHSVLRHDDALKPAVS